MGREREISEIDIALSIKYNDSVTNKEHNRE